MELSLYQLLLFCFLFLSLMQITYFVNNNLIKSVFEQCSMTICALEAFSVTVIVPPVQTGHKRFLLTPCLYSRCFGSSTLAEQQWCSMFLHRRLSGTGHSHVRSIQSPTLHHCSYIHKMQENRGVIV